MKKIKFWASIVLLSALLMSCESITSSDVYLAEETQNSIIGGWKYKATRNCTSGETYDEHEKDLDLTYGDIVKVIEGEKSVYIGTYSSDGYLYRYEFKIMELTKTSLVLKPTLEPQKELLYSRKRGFFRWLKRELMYIAAHPY